MTELVLNKFLPKWREDLRRQWEAGVFQSEDLYQTSVANIQALGQCKVLEQISELEYEQLTGRLSDE